MLWLRILGLIMLPWRLAEWSTWGAPGAYTVDGKLEPFGWRLSLAWTMWKARYWIDWS